MLASCVDSSAPVDNRPQDLGSHVVWVEERPEPFDIAALRVVWNASPGQGVPRHIVWESKGCGVSDTWFALVNDSQNPPHLVRRWWFPLDGIHTRCGVRLSALEERNQPASVREASVITNPVNALASSDMASLHMVDSHGGEREMTAAERHALTDGDYATSVSFEPGQFLRATFSAPIAARGVYMVVGDSPSFLPERDTLRYEPPWEARAMDVEVGRRHAVAEEHEHVVQGSSHAIARRRWAPIHLPETQTVTLRFADARAGIRSATVREFGVYEGTRAPFFPPWILSVNANPSGQIVPQPGHGYANDVYYARFLTQRLQPIVPAFSRDTWFYRKMDDRGALLDAVASDPNLDHSSFEAIRGDDPGLVDLIHKSYPPPVVVLSGSNAWDFSLRTAPYAPNPRRWFFNPLLSSREAGLGDLATLVQSGAGAPMLGLCGGAQILAMLSDALRHDRDGWLARWLLRTTGDPIRGTWEEHHVLRWWPGSTTKPVVIQFAPGNDLFADLMLMGRRASSAFPESHVDVLRESTLVATGWSIEARSERCWNQCMRIPEAFMRKNGMFSRVGTQFHPEQARFSDGVMPSEQHAGSDPDVFLAAVMDRFFLELERGRPASEPSRMDR